LARSGDRQGAIAIWQQILKSAPKDASWRPLIEQGVAALSGGGQPHATARGASGPRQG
jgi:cytochrome c-type biogenesis protein CcmH